MNPSIRGPRFPSYLFVAGFAIGLAARLLMLPYLGMVDTWAYYQPWAQAAFETDILAAYSGKLHGAGSYFPFQIQILGAVWGFAENFGSELRLDFYLVLKWFNLFFDTANFFLLVVILRNFGAPRGYAFLYWLHPWFLAVFSLSYIESHFCFFVLLTVYAVRRSSRLPHFLLASLPLAIAFSMKPQAQILMISTALFALVRDLHARRIQTLAILVGPCVFFVVYSLILTAEIHARGGGVNLTFLADQYLGTSELMPCLSGTRLNHWYSIAQALKEPGAKIPTVSDQLSVIGPIQVRHLAGLAVLAIVGLYSFRAAAESRSEAQLGTHFLLASTVAVATVPYVMTQAHENHFFAASALLIIVLGLSRDRKLHVAAHVIFLLDFFQMYIPWSRSDTAKMLREYYPEALQSGLAMVSTLAFIALLTSLWQMLRRSKISEGESVAGITPVG